MDNATPQAQTFATTLKTTKSSLFGSQRVAMRVLTTNSDAVYYLHGDHPSTRLRTGLGSTSLTTEVTGQLVQARYTPFGGLHWESGAAPTDFGFTGQRAERGLGLMDYHARFYAASLGRFVSADSLIPDIYNPTDFDHYVYGRNNPMKFIDPSGHISCEKLGTEECDENGAYKISTPRIALLGRKNLEDKLLLIALNVFAESINGSFPYKIMEITAWVFFNRFADPIGYKEPTSNALFKLPFESFDAAIEAYLDPRNGFHEAFMKAYQATLTAYEQYANGLPDPTQGSTEFSHADDLHREVVDDDGNVTWSKDFKDYEELYSWLAENASRQDYYDSLEGLEFGYYISQPFTYKDKWGHTHTAIFVAATDGCGNVSNCGANYPPIR